MPSTDPQIPSGFDDNAIGFDDAAMGFDGAGGSSGLPVVTSVNPASGPDAGGTTVTITGTGFNGPTTTRKTFDDSGWAIPIGEVTVNVNAVLNRVQSSGATMLRTEAYWRALQPANATNATAGNNDDLDTTKLAELDAVVNGCFSRGIHVILGVQYTPLWARPGFGTTIDDKIPPTRDQTNYADYANFAYLIAARYGSKVTLEIWNEPNISQFWKQPASTSTMGAIDSPDVIEYSKMLKAAHIAVKTGVVAGRTARTAHPEVLVLTGGTSPATGDGSGAGNYAPISFLLNVMFYAHDSFDHVAHHPYMWVCPPNLDVSWNPMKQIETLWGALKIYGRPDADIWATEVGIISRPDISGTDPNSQPCPTGGYVTGAPGPGYNTSGRAINYTLAATRAQEYADFWRDPAHFDTEQQRSYTGPFCVYKLNDTANETTWADDETHFGAFVGPGVAGAAKPFESVWATMFASHQANQSTTTVSIGGTPATIITISDTQIVVTTPAHVAGTFDTIVTTSAGSSLATAADLFTFTSAPPGVPVVLGLNPSAGPETGGNHVTITVDDTTGVTAVAFGPLAATFTITSSTTLDAVAPAHAPGPVDVTVRNASGTSGITAADVYFYLPPPPSSTTATARTRRWVILARDANFKLQAAVEDFTSLTFLSRLNDVGSFTLTIPDDSPAVAILNQPRSGIVVLSDGQVVFSGPRRGRLRANHAGLGTLTISGTDDMFHLAARLAHPSPHIDAPQYPDAFDIRTGPCSTMLFEFVGVNLGISSLARRRLPALTAGNDQGIGSTVTGIARWQQLLLLLQQLALASNPPLNFRIRQSGSALIFSTSFATDRSHTTIFQTATGTLGDYEYEETGSNANYIYGAGVGIQVGRLIAEGENGTDINEWGLVEAFLADQSLTTTGQIAQKVAAELAAQTGTHRLDLQVIDTAGLSWPAGYDLGDKVSVIIDGVQIPELVRAIQVDLGPNGDTERVTPSVSSPSPKTIVREQSLFSIVRSMAARIADLERNQ